MERIGADFGARCSVLSYLLDRLRGYPGIHSAKAEVEGRLLCKFPGGSFRWPGCRCNHHTHRCYQNTAADAPFWRGNLPLGPACLQVLNKFIHSTRRMLLQSCERYGPTKGVGPFSKAWRLVWSKWPRLVRLWFRAMNSLKGSSMSALVDIRELCSDLAV